MQKKYHKNVTFMVNYKTVQVYIQKKKCTYTFFIQNVMELCKKNYTTVWYGNSNNSITYGKVKMCSFY